MNGISTISSREYHSVLLNFVQSVEKVLVNITIYCCNRIILKLLN